MQTKRNQLEEALSNECKLLAKKYKWKLIKASVLWPGPQQEKKSTQWRRLIVTAYKYAATCRALALEDSFRDLIESKNEQNIQKKDCIHELFKGSGNLLDDEDYELSLSYHLRAFEGTLKESIENAEKLADELYIDRCTLPTALYINMKYDIEIKKAERLKQDINNPNTLFSIGLKLKENANDIWEDAKHNSRNFDDWLEQVHRLFPLYKLSGRFLLNASDLYKAQSNIEKRDQCLQEEYSADEFAADCYAGICSYGRSDHLAILDIFSGLKEGVEYGKRKLLFNYASLPRLPKFVFNSINQFLETKVIEKDIAELFVREYYKIIEKNLDEFSIILLKEIEVEEKEDKRDQTSISISELVDRETFDMICCPACKSELELVDLEKEEKEETGIDGFLVCMNKECRKKYPIECGVVKWGKNMIPIQLY